MIDRPRPSGPRADEEPDDLAAPELHNDEQDDEQEQSQTIAEEALHGEARHASPLDSIKSDEPGELMDDSTQDLIDHMRDMEQSGRIDMGAFAGEPNHDDDEDKYGSANRLDDLPGDGALEGAGEDEEADDTLEEPDDLLDDPADEEER